MTPPLPLDPNSQDYSKLLEAARVVDALTKKIKYDKIKKYFPDEGPYRRGLYKKHMQFFAAGKTHRERLALAANRIGKTESMGGYEVALHLTGLYPEWWPGIRFDRPVKVWAAGDTNQTVRDILQEKMLGDYDDIGSGLIPKDLIEGLTPKMGMPQAIEMVRVKHKSGGSSILGFKSYDQKRKAFQGTGQHIIWLDEEPPLEVYTECLLRTMTTNGIVISTFTPLSGISETVMHFLPEGDFTAIDNTKSQKFIIMADWDDVPHLTKEQKEQLWASIPPFQRDARSKGIPQLGAGVIYPVPESEMTIDDFEIPEHWPKQYAMDVGWNATACVWMARDPETGTEYIYSVYKKGEAEPAIHAQAIKSRGEWIPGLIDPAARGRAQKDGVRLIETYHDLGLNVEPAENAVETGIYSTWEALSTGKLRIFKSCRQWFEEVRLYRRDEKGKIVKTNDHLMDCTRYGKMGNRYKIKEVKVKRNRAIPRRRGWMG